MPPVPRKSDVDHDIDTTATSEESTMAPILIKKHSAQVTRKEMIPLPVAIRSGVVGLASWFILNYFGLFDGPFHWMAVFAVSVVVDTSSPTANNAIQYIYPLLLVGHFVAAKNYPSVIQCIAFMPTVLYLIGVPMSVCLHRYFSHAAFTTTRFGQLVAGVTSCFAYQRGPLWWSAKHTRHHHYCDQPEDPHSACQQGFLYAWVGWTMNPNHMSERDLTFNNPALFVPELYFLDRFYLFPVAVAFSLLEPYVGRSFIAYSILLPMLFCRLITLLFNVEFHPAHEARRCKSVDRREMFLGQIVGESEHDVHHKVPNKSKRNDLDFPYWITLFWMEKVGLVWNCR